MFLFYDPTYFICMIPAILLMALAQWRVNSTYLKWGKTRNQLNITGLDAARRLLSSGGLMGIGVEGIGGKLTDRYDPSKNTLFLSQEVATTPSVASLAIAAHEIGHAMQDSEGYLPLRVRSALVPAANIGSTFGWILIFAGLLLGLYPVAWAGVAVFSLGAVFALATLPVEFNASARARDLLAATGLTSYEEDARGVNAMLNAAAMTYVAALATAVLQLLYFVSLLGGFGGRRRS
jgi:Zn-dependent membrane protease YugP